METATATATSTEPTKANPLRRAKYVNVEKLVLSHYDVNRQRLDYELAKLKASNDSENVDGDDAHTQRCGTPIEDAGLAGAKPNAWATSNLSVLPGGPLRAPTAGKYHQNRLQPPRDGFNLCLLVGKVEIVVDKRRVDGSRVLVAEVEVGDESGSISLRARDDQIDLLRQVSDNHGAVVLRNCTMELYLGKHLRLGVTKWGKLSSYPDGIESTPYPPSCINQELNFSLVDLNTVATTKMPDEPHFPMPVATVHHKHPKQHQHAEKHSQYPSPRATTRNRSRSQGGNYVHKKKTTDDWQQQQQRRPLNVTQKMDSADPPLYSFQHQQSGGSGSPSSFRAPQMHYQQYSDTDSVYSYQSQHHEHPVGLQSRNHQFRPEDHYTRQQYIYQQYHDLHLRHAHQMMLLQQQQESQIRILAQQAAADCSSIISQVDSHESGGGYSVHTPSGGMAPPPDQFRTGTFQQSPVLPLQSVPRGHAAINSKYQYGPPLPSSTPSRGEVGMSTYATISPPMTPTHSQAPHQHPEDT